MSRPVRYLLHILTLILGFALIAFFDDKDLLPAFYLFSLFSQYVLLSPILRFNFWIRFIVSIILWVVSFVGNLVFAVIIAFETHLNEVEFTILILVVYSTVVVFLYELFSSSSKETLLGRGLKRVFRKMLDPHNQGIH